MQSSPQDVVHTHYALWLGILGVVYHRRLSLHPDVAPLLSKHPVLPGGHLPFSKHWKQEKKNQHYFYISWSVAETAHS